MFRYFLEVSYKGAAYSGFQAQVNANTIQSEVEKACQVLLRQPVALTGSSRTDAGVHALQNYFHVDIASPVEQWGLTREQFVYKMNAILPPDIVLRDLVAMPAGAHCRFDAESREYKYFIYRKKNPFLADRAYYFPYSLDVEMMQRAAGLIRGYEDFTSFSKRNTQVKTFSCRVSESEWKEEGDCLVYRVRANRFLRGMVRALAATMLRVGRGKIDISEFQRVIEAKDCTLARFDTPSHGLFLVAVNFPEGYFKKT